MHFWAKLFGSFTKHTVKAILKFECFRGIQTHDLLAGRDKQLAIMDTTDTIFLNICYASLFIYFRVLPFQVHYNMQ